MMNSFSIKFMTIVGIFTFMLSCGTSKDAGSNQLLSLEMETTGMGGMQQFTASNAKMTEKTVNRSESSQEVTKSVSKSDLSQYWNKITGLVSDLNLDNFENLESPTQERLFDGARATVITLHFKDKTVTSAAFDEGNPPAELKALYDYLVSVVNQ